MSLSQYGTIRSTTSFRHSVRGTSMPAYRGSASCENSLPGSIGGGGTS